LSSIKNGPLNKPIFKIKNMFLSTIKNDNEMYEDIQKLQSLATVSSNQVNSFINGVGTNNPINFNSAVFSSIINDCKTILLKYKNKP
jgi:hypothetical protein